MNLEQAKQQARIIFKFDLDFETKGGIRYILRREQEGETITSIGDGMIECNDGKKHQQEDGRILLGAGPTWLIAMKQATRFRLEKMQAENKVKQELNLKDQREAEMHMNQFLEFLMEKFGKEFDESKQAPASQPEVSAG